MIVILHKQDCLNIFLTFSTVINVYQFERQTDFKVQQMVYFFKQTQHFIFMLKGVTYNYLIVESHSKIVNYQHYFLGSWFPGWFPGLSYTDA